MASLGWPAVADKELVRQAGEAGKEALVGPERVPELLEAACAPEVGDPEVVAELGRGNPVSLRTSANVGLALSDRPLAGARWAQTAPAPRRSKGRGNASHIADELRFAPLEAHEPRKDWVDNRVTRKGGPLGIH